MMRITVQPINDIREVHNNRPLSDYLYHSDWQLEALAGASGLRNLR